MASNKLTKAQIITALCESSGLDKKTISSVLDGLTDLVRRQLGEGGPGEVTIPGLVKLKAKTTPAAFNKDSDVTLTSAGVSVTRTFLANATSQVFTTGAFGAAVNQTTVSVSFPGLKGKSAVPAASSPTVFVALPKGRRRPRRSAATSRSRKMIVCPATSRSRITR